jgi:hypothetical protein
MVASVVVMLTACTTSAQPPSSTPPPPTPASSEYLDALEHTRSLGTASADIEVTTQRGDAATRVTGSGAVAFYDGHGDLLWEAADGSVRRERSNARGVFVQEAPPDGQWQRLASTPATVPLTDPLRGLGQVTEPRSLGPDVVDGEATERYSGTVSATPEQLDLLGLSPAERDALPADRSALDVRITAWIDDGGRMLRIDRELQSPGTDTPPVTAWVSTRLSDFSRVIDLSTPPGVED